MTPIEVFAPDAAVTLTVLGAAAPSPLHGRVVEMNGGTVRVSTPARLAPGTSVRIEGNDTLLLGEICALQPEKGGWIAAVQIVHSLRSLSELERLNRALLGDGSRDRALRPAPQPRAE